MQPFAVGGTTEEANLELRCRAHNQYEADLFFGSGEPLIMRERPDVIYAVNSVRTELGAVWLPSLAQSVLSCPPRRKTPGSSSLSAPL